MADDDDDMAWYDDENSWIDVQRNAGAFRTYEDEVRARVMFRHFPKIMERVQEIKSSRPPARRTRERKASVTSRLKAAQRAGAKDVDIKPDGTVTAAFGSEPIPNEWDTDLGIAGKGIPDKFFKDKPRGH